MHRLTALAPALAAAACTVQRPPLHLIERPLPQGQWAWCLTPAGETTGWTTSASSDSETPYGTCAAPNRFVLVHVCGPKPPSAAQRLQSNRQQREETTQAGQPAATADRTDVTDSLRDGTAGAEYEIPADDEYVLRANRRPESEVQAMLAARLRLSRDGSLVGDRFQGRPFCAPMPPS